MPGLHLRARIGGNQIRHRGRRLAITNARWRASTTTLPFARPVKMKCPETVRTLVWLNAGPKVKVTTLRAPFARYKRRRRCHDAGAENARRRDRQQAVGAVVHDEFGARAGRRNRRARIEIADVVAAVERIDRIAIIMDQERRKPARRREAEDVQRNFTLDLILAADLNLIFRTSDRIELNQTVDIADAGELLVVVGGDALQVAERRAAVDGDQRVEHAGVPWLASEGVDHNALRIRGFEADPGRAGHAGFLRLAGLEGTVDIDQPVDQAGFAAGFAGSCVVEVLLGHFHSAGRVKAGVFRMSLKLIAETVSMSAFAVCDPHRDKSTREHQQNPKGSNCSPHGTTPSIG